MPEFKAACGCKLYAYVEIEYDCECCGTEYSITDAEITSTCDEHTQYD